MKLLVIALRGCPIAGLGPYGNEWIATPNLDRLAVEGITFDRVIAEDPTVVGAHQTWRSGHNASDDLITRLRSHGCRTLLIRNLSQSDDDPTFAQGWDEVIDAPPAAEDRSPCDPLLRQLPGILDRLGEIERWLIWVEIDRLIPPWVIQQDIFDIYVEDLIEEDTEPSPDDPIEDDEDDDEVEEGDDEEIESLADVEAEAEVDDEEEEDDNEEEPEVVLEPVRPWHDPPMGWFDHDDLASWELLHRSLAATMTVFDAELGSIFELARERSVSVMFTAARGLPLGEHGLIGYHRPWLHEELVHVPLLLRLADHRGTGARVPTLSSNRIVGSLVRELFGLEPLEPALRLEERMTLNRSIEAMPIVSRAEQGEAKEWSLRTPTWTLIVPVTVPEEDDPRGPMLFEYPADRWEACNLATARVEVVDELMKFLPGSDAGDDDQGPSGGVRLGTPE